MPVLWHFCSYDQTKLDTLGEFAIADALLRDPGEFDDASAVRRIAGRVASKGLSYAGLSPRDSELLDQVIPFLFSPEGLETELNVEPESKDGLAPSIVSELIEQFPNVVCLPWLLRGRRFGVESVDFTCNYVILSPANTDDLLEECIAVVESQHKWTRGYIPDVIRECLIESLSSIQTKGRYSIGMLG